MCDYPIVVIPLSDDEGGGYLAVYPDLPGCMSDGNTPKEALENAKDAFECWMEVQKDRGIEIPLPGASTLEARAKRQALVNAVKTLAESLEDADNHIAKLEAALEAAVERLSVEWSAADQLAALTAAASSNKHLELH